ncbi:MAG TPA: DUF192 domain-containing protein [Candidatus Absconditabacterales bacterium]|nr:DUF192 domain-containing protein [Candidatus Absconditabacterales bacterium]HNG97024.1 DUF192 domain-containing protein [Candidatus Absconditabacterales bacterium]
MSYVQRSKSVKPLFWLTILVLFNIILYILYIKPLRSMNTTGGGSGLQMTIDSGHNDGFAYQIIATGGGVPQTGLPTKELVLGSGKQTIMVEVADESEEQRIGLMFRANLPDTRGMLFVFPDIKPVSFWMQNTYIGLDLLYIGSDGIIKHIHNNAKPLDLSGLPSIEPIKYVIEVNDTFVETFDIQIGDRVEGL